MNHEAPLGVRSVRPKSEQVRLGGESGASLDEGEVHWPLLGFYEESLWLELGVTTGIFANKPGNSGGSLLKRLHLAR